MAGDAVERRAGSALGVLRAMAVDAPSHRQGTRGRSEPGQSKEVVGQLRSGVGADHPHALDRTVAGLALEPEAHMGEVGEIRELGKLEHALPRNRLSAPRVSATITLPPPSMARAWGAVRLPLPPH